MNKSTKNLFFVRSPLQIINAYEASQYFHTKNNILILAYNSTNSNTMQLKALANAFNAWEEIIEINNKKTKFFQYIKLIILLKKYYYDKIFIGNFSSLSKAILSNLKYNESYIIDDGTATFIEQKRIHNYFKTHKLNLREMRFFLLGLKAKIKTRINFFTFFNLLPLDNECITKHTFEHTKKLYQLSDTINDNNLYFLGQHLVQESFLSQKNYISYLQQIISKYSSLKIIYIPHRSEPISKEIRALESKQFEILQNEMPIELFFLSKKIYPSRIAGFFSTALYTLSTIFPKSTVESFSINIEDVDKGQETITICQHFFKNTTVIQTPLLPCK